VFLLPACGDDVELGNDGAGGTAASSSGGAAGADGSVGGGGGGVPATTAACQGHIYECGDLVDNDNDGLVDSLDPDCLGPCDDTEDSYFGGIPGQNNAPCRQDCYFDQDTGAGNDDCYWNHQCDPLSEPPGYPPSGDNKCAYDSSASTPGTSKSCDELYNAQSAACESYCKPLTPNGCDCFGCCELPAGSGKFVWLGSTVDLVGSCDRDHVGDPSACKPCTPVPSCLNGCAKCELCIGKDTLPSDCKSDGGTTDSGTNEQCPSGAQPCGLEGQSPCKDGQYCITGCCITIPA
jgi:hypothetical protein